MDQKKRIIHNLFVKATQWSPGARLKRLSRNMKLHQIVLSVLIVTCIITLIIYYLNRLVIVQPNNRKTHRNLPKVPKSVPIKHVPLDEVYTDIDKRDTDTDPMDLKELRPVLMLDTPGCKIPLEMLRYENVTSTARNPSPCGKRAVFITRTDQNKIKFTIAARSMKNYLKSDSPFECCYRFMVYVRKSSDMPVKTKYGPCKKVTDRAIIPLESDFIHVKCTQNNNEIYEDYYAFCKKINLPKKTKNKNCNLKYNVLMLGLDTMSLTRFAKMMPKSRDFVLDNNWLIYRGFHKVADNTYPNLMTVLTGKSVPNINNCTNNKDECLDFMIWKKFKDAGYVTAYGEDQYATFKRPTIDHYQKTFLRITEKFSPHDKGVRCSGHVTSGQQVLDYAFDFANTYKRDSFYGFFWINTWSHDSDNYPEDGDKLIEDFLIRLSHTGVLSNTFIIFFSDHGLRFGHLRFDMEAYYDNRLPMLTMWPASYFKVRHPEEYRFLTNNQYRLITPYDLYNTLLDIKRLSFCENSTKLVLSEGCRNCRSMFGNISDQRTCQDVNIKERWCSCHKLTPLPVHDIYGRRAVDVILYDINKRTKQMKTRKCWTCAHVELKEIVRLHFYHSSTDKSAIFYVVAFVTKPANRTYEATVRRRVGSSDVVILDDISVPTIYRNSHCTLRNEDLKYCTCKKLKKC